MPYVTSRDGCRLHYEVVGEGPTIVLQTGAAGDGQMWRHAGYVDRLDGFRRVLFDHRGHGESDRPDTDEAHAMERYVDDLVALFDALQEQRVIYWGYSAGMAVGFALAAAHGDRLSAFIGSGGVNPRGAERDPEEEHDFARTVRVDGWDSMIRAYEEDESIAFPNWLRQQFRETPAETIPLYLQAWVTWEGHWAALKRIETPTLLIAGTDEDPDDVNAQAVSEMRHGERVRLDGLGHVGAYLRSDLAVHAARDFLSRLELAR